MNSDFQTKWKKKQDYDMKQVEKEFDKNGQDGDLGTR